MSFLQCMLLFIVALSIRGSTNGIGSTTPLFVDTITHRLQNLRDELRKEEKQFRIDHHKLEKEKQVPKLVDNTDVFQLNVGGEIIITTRQTLTKIPKSTLSFLFYGRWEHQLPKDQHGNIFLDCNPILFRHLLDQLQIVEINNSTQLYPPSQSSLVEPFKKMLKKLGLQPSSSSEGTNVIAFNVGGQRIIHQRATFLQASNSTFTHKMIHSNNDSDVFVDYDPKLFQHLLNHLRKKSFNKNTTYGLPSKEERISFERMLIDLGRHRLLPTSVPFSRLEPIVSSPIIIDTKWKPNGLTVAGRNGYGNQSNQLNYPRGIYVDDDNQCIYIADSDNQRIVEWKWGATVGKIVAGGNGQGNRMNQLNDPRDVVVDEKTDSLIICDRGNRRVVRWPRRNDTYGQIIIVNIDCSRLTMKNNGDLYVSDWKKNEVRKWSRGETDGTMVAGRNGRQIQLNIPTYLAVDDDDSVYVSDNSNHRVMKYMEGVSEGMVVAGGQGEGENLTQLYHPQGVIVDHLGNLYVADSSNNRIVCWSKGASKGRIILGGNGEGEKSNQLHDPQGLSFDRQGHLYVVDGANHRVQKFEIDLN